MQFFPRDRKLQLELLHNVAEMRIQQAMQDPSPTKMEPLVALLDKLGLCGVVWCGVVWCGVVWCGVVWCGVVWCGVVWCGVVWCGVVWCGVVWCGVVWCGVVWCGVVWCGVVWCGVCVRGLSHAAVCMWSVRECTPLTHTKMEAFMALPDTLGVCSVPRTCVRVCVQCVCVDASECVSKSV